MKARGVFVSLLIILICVFLLISGCSSSSDPVPQPASAQKSITVFSLNGISGTINETAKTIAIAMPFGTDVTAMVATFTTTGASVKVGSTVQVSGTTANDFTLPVTYTVTAADSSTQDYTVTVTVALSSAKAITSFILNGVAGTINETNKTIGVTMPYGTSVTNLVATFTTTGASVKVGSTVQVSGTTANDFTLPVTYTVTAADSSTQDYTVTVTVALSSAKAFTAFSLNGSAGTINETNKTIAVTMPFGTYIMNLVATFTTTGASVKVGSTVQISGTTAHNFTSPVTYTVIAADSSTQDYIVTVTVAASPEKAITSYSINGVAGTINETAKTIAVTLPDGTDYSALVATFTTTGVSVNVGTTVQVSGATANDFTLPVTYTVTAADSSTQTYVVNVIEHGKIISALKVYSSYRPSRLAFQNGVAYIADGSVRIIDVSTPASPAVFSTIGSADAAQDGIFDIMMNVSVSNNELLIGAAIGCNGWCDISPYAGNLYSYDITDRANPVMTSYISMNTGDIILDGNTAYVSQFNYPVTFNVINTAVQPQSSILGSVNITTNGKLAKSGNLIFMSCNNPTNFSSLTTIDVTNPASPSILHAGSNCWVNVAHDRIVLSGNAAYIADHTYGLLVLDISNPTSPAIVMTIPALSSINDISVYNGYLYAADGASGIRVFDISNPLNPVYTKSIPTTPYTATLVAVSDGAGLVSFIDPSSTSYYYLGVFLL
ncbi:MAG: hypothetical protein ABSC11_01770 [Smithella sp.]|jgi:hypothetical protein